MSEVYLEMAPANCGVQGGSRCSSGCGEPVTNRQHLHLVAVDHLRPEPYGVCSEGCAMAVIAEHGLTIVPKPAEVTS